MPKIALMTLKYDLRKERFFEESSEINDIIDYMSSQDNKARQIL